MPEPVTRRRMAVHAGPSATPAATSLTKCIPE